MYITCIYYMPVKLARLHMAPSDHLRSYIYMNFYMTVPGRRCECNAEQIFRAARAAEPACR